MAAIGENLTPQLAQDYLNPLANPLSITRKGKAGIGQSEGGRQPAYAVIFLINAAREIF